MKSPSTDVHTPSAGYVPEIDGLRAVAVLAVILFHLSGTLPGGFTGVDVFFVISGYVVSGSLARGSRLPLGRFVLGFYARRIVRIYPALIACLVPVTLATVLLVPESWLSTSTTKTALYAFFGLSNLALVWFDDGYFSPRVEFNAFTHTWSLAVEEQFYLVFPFLAFLWLRGREREGVAGRLAGALFPALLAVSLVYAWWETQAAKDHAFYLLPSRFWELASGAVLYQWGHGKAGFLRSELLRGAGVIGGLLLVGIGFFVVTADGMPFPGALLPVIGTALVIVGVGGGSSPVGAMLLGNRVFVLVGKLSYSLYLWHWPVFVVLRWTVGLESAAARAAALALTAAFSAASYVAVETPARTSRRIVGRPSWQIVTVGWLATAVACLGAREIFRHQPKWSLSVTRDVRTWHPDPWPSEGGERPRSLEGRQLFVLGDSHAEAYRTMLRQLVEWEGVKVRMLAKGGCPVVGLVMRTRTWCRPFVEQSAADIEKRARPGDVVFLASLRMDRLCDQWVAYPPDLPRAPMTAKRREKILREADELITRFERRSLRVVVDAPKPVFPSPPFRCADPFNAMNPICAGGFTVERSFLDERRKIAMELLAELRARHPELVVWDATESLCGPTTCSAFDGEKPLFFDGDHLSAHGNRRIYPDFVALLKTIWPTPG